MINELNSESCDSISRNSFPNYTMEVDNLEIVDRKSRYGMLIHSQVHYKRRRDLESQGTSTIWVQLSHTGRKPILVQTIYRQFQRLQVHNSDTIQAQITRWNKILEKWELAMTEAKEIIVMGDCNLNTLRWDTPVSEKTTYERAQMPLVESFQDRILSKGFKIINSAPTRTKTSADIKPSCLDPNNQQQDRENYKSPV